MKAGEKADVVITQTTLGEYIIRIETGTGSVEVALTPEEFAKAVTGKLAKAVVTQA